jgi:DNA-binding SARP family transcriptional activator
MGEGTTTSSSTANLHFAVLGELRAYRDGAELTKLGSPQQQAVLLLLLLHAPHAVSLARLVDALWDENPPRSAVRTVRTYIWRLRRVLGTGGTPAGELVSVGDGYRLDIPSFTVDAHHAESLFKNAAALRASGQNRDAATKLDEALALWRGEPLVGASGPVVDRQRDQLAQLRLGIIEERADLDLDAGEFQAAVLLLGELAPAHPLRESLQCLLIRALYGAGRQADALAAFDTTRVRLAEEIGVEPGHELLSLHQQILHGEAPHIPEARRPERARPMAPPGGPALPIPAQLPPDLPDFTGHTAELEDLRRVMVDRDRGAPAVVALCGMSGIGKTAFAVHLAHQVRARYPDGQLYARFDSGTDDLDAIGDALAGFLTAVGAGAGQLPADLAGRSRLLRSMLDGRDILIVLDNVTDPARIRDLIPGSARCGMIITSRARLAGLPLTRQRHLGVLGPDEALALLGRDIGTERVAAQRQGALALVTACGWLPLAIRIVGSRLAGRPGWPLSTMADRLADGRRSLTQLRAGDLAVETVFERGYRQLSTAQARALRLLARTGTGALTLAESALALGLDELSTEDLLESLVDAAMLEPAAPGRYRFHVLVRTFARHRPAGAEGEPLTPVCRRPALR